MICPGSTSRILKAHQFMKTVLLKISRFLDLLILHGIYWGGQEVYDIWGFWTLVTIFAFDLRMLVMEFENDVIVKFIVVTHI